MKNSLVLFMLGSVLLLLIISVLIFSLSRVSSMVIAFDVGKNIRPSHAINVTLIKARVSFRKVCWSLLFCVTVFVPKKRFIVSHISGLRGTEHADGTGMCHSLVGLWPKIL